MFFFTERLNGRFGRACHTILAMALVDVDSVVVFGLSLMVLLFAFLYYLNSYEKKNVETIITCCVCWLFFISFPVSSFKSDPLSL